MQAATATLSMPMPSAWCLILRNMNTPAPEGSLMRRVAVILACSCLAGVALPRAQTPQTQPQPVFRGGVDLVTLDVTVIDKDGKPVRGLKPEDFTVTLEKQTRPVRALDFLEFGSAAGSTAEARQTTNQPGQARPARRGGRTIVLLFDEPAYKPAPGKA